jgi:pSer/pThr/pTyr-binding forkhead associated (FHA) protein
VTLGRSDATDQQPPVFAGLKILNGERAGFVLYPLTVDTLVGRLSTVQVFMPDVRCSRRHCLIHWNGQAYALVDLSANGTYLNGQRVDKQTEVALSHGDRIRCGATELEFRVAAQPASPTNEPKEPVELVFDFGSADDPDGGLDKVFFDHETEQWSSKSTQRMPPVPGKKPDE